MRRSLTATALSLALTVFAPWALPDVASAQTPEVAPATSDAQGSVETPDLSALCNAPNADIAAPAPLPHLAEKILHHKTMRILAIGSSSTWGVGSTSARRTYPAQLASILDGALKGAKAKIINRGVSGEVAQTTAERLRREVALERPDLVLWQVGTNDAIARVPIDEFEHTLESTVGWLKENNIDTVLVGLQYTPASARDEFYVAVREAMRRVATANDILYVRRYDAMQFLAKAKGTSDLVSGDGLHLNDLGYQCMAEHIAHAVIVNLFLRRRDVRKPAAQP